MRPRHRESWAHRNLYRFLISREPPRAKGRSKRKRRKSHSVQRQAIDRGDEARSAICTRDRPLRRISRTDENGGARTHALGSGRMYTCVTHPRRVAWRESIPELDTVVEKKKSDKKRYWEIIRVSLEPDRYSLTIHHASSLHDRSLYKNVYTAVEPHWYLEDRDSRCL